jgi:prephenate dehydrogenase
MRGSEKKGIAGASADKFKGANALITPLPQNKEENLTRIEQLYRDAGFSTLTRVTPEKHDEQVAYVSQLMHALSVSVVNSSQASDDTLLFAGNSFQELTRIADINDSLWSELFLNNKEALLQSIMSFEAELETFKQAIEADDEEALKDFLIRARDQRRDWY